MPVTLHHSDFMTTVNAPMTDILQEKRFQKPDGFKFGYFTAADGVRLRYGVVKPEVMCRGHIVLLHGFSEFIEKYFETIRDFAAQGYAVYSFDWGGQGRSDRYFDDKPERAYNKGFDHDVHHLRSFMHRIVGDAGPKYIVAHSMGGHMALRYLKENPGVVKAAALSAPMIAFKMPLPRWLARTVLKILHVLKLDKIEAVHGEGWVVKAPAIENDPRSRDPVRRLVHYQWCKHDPSLRLGNISFGWVYRALRSVVKMSKPGYLESIKTPVLLAVAEQDEIVDRDAIRRAGDRLPHGDLIPLDGYHELFMERDEIRGPFLKRIFDFFDKER